MRDTSKRAEATKRAIKEAFRSMVSEGTGHINVTALAARAGIHRKTFYLHYMSIEALYEDVLKDLVEEYSAYYADTVRGDFTFRDINRKFFEYIATCGAFEERIICNPSYRGFCNALFLAVAEKNVKASGVFSNLAEGIRGVIVKFTVYATLEFYREWVADGKTLPLEKLEELSGRLIERGIASYTAGGGGTRKTDGGSNAAHPCSERKKPRAPGTGGDLMID